jgi:hypothetical protein
LNKTGAVAAAAVAAVFVAWFVSTRILIAEPLRRGNSDLIRFNGGVPFDFTPLRFDALGHGQAFTLQDLQFTLCP